MADLGVNFYPTGIMINNAAPMSFFSQGKTVITTYGELTPQVYKKFTLDGTKLQDLQLSDTTKLKALGKQAKDYYWKNLSWDVFISKMYSHLTKITA